jgi:hypothetical protein
MSDGESRRAATIAGAVALVVAMVAGIASIQYLVDPSYRGAAIRLVAAVALFIAVTRIRAFMRSAVEWPSAWEDRAGETVWAPPTHGQFEHFHDEIRFSVRSQRYFDHVLWPRLNELASEATDSPARLDRPPARRFARGPSLSALGALLDALEKRR